MIFPRKQKRGPMIFYVITLICLIFHAPLFCQEEEAKEEFFLSTPEQIATLGKDSEDLVEDLLALLVDK